MVIVAFQQFTCKYNHLFSNYHLFKDIFVLIWHFARLFVPLQRENTYLYYRRGPFAAQLVTHP